jgi:hypothetical protein
MSLPGVICQERDRECELCGKIEETRPYGPNGQRICFSCGQLDKAGTERRMAAYLFGTDKGDIPMKK